MDAGVSTRRTTTTTTPSIKHRDSRNMQHPQPRRGPATYLHQLESQARHFAVDHDSAASPLSVSVAQLNAHPPPHDEDFDDADARASFVTARPPKIPTTSSTAALSGAAGAAHPLLPQRKPSGRD
ncbi:MAG: hypothetical protein M1826_004584 [Phylliscum demangeonii]|nr:MAG: hypothetical protein M1826_004584 [Phylliscum demangeonii]